MHRSDVVYSRKHSEAKSFDSFEDNVFFLSLSAVSVLLSPLRTRCTMVKKFWIRSFFCQFCAWNGNISKILLEVYCCDAFVTGFLLVIVWISSLLAVLTFSYAPSVRCSCHFLSVIFSTLRARLKWRGFRGDHKYHFLQTMNKIATKQKRWKNANNRSVHISWISQHIKSFERQVILNVFMNKFKFSIMKRSCK